MEIVSFFNLANVPLYLPSGYTPKKSNLKVHDLGRIQSLERGEVHLAEKLMSKQKQIKGHSSNGCPLYTMKYIKILIHSFIVKLHCLMNTVTALSE